MCARPSIYDYGDEVFIKDLVRILTNLLRPYVFVFEGRATGINRVFHELYSTRI